MFYYEFQKASLIKAVVLSGSNFTVYSNKRSFDEIDFLVENNHMNFLGAFSGDHPYHPFFHNSFLSYDQMDHKHVTINTPNRKDAIEGFFNEMVEHQNNIPARISQKAKRAKELDDFKMKIGVTALPKFIQEGLDNFDTTGVLIDKDEKNLFFIKLNDYLNNPQVHLIENISDIAQNFVKKNVRIYTSFYYDENLSETGTLLMAFFKELFVLRETLLEMQQSTTNHPLLQTKLSNTLTTIRSSEYYRAMPAESKDWIRSAANQLPAELKQKHDSFTANEQASSSSTNTLFHGFQRAGIASVSPRNNNGEFVSRSSNRSFCGIL